MTTSFDLDTGDIVRMACTMAGLVSFGDEPDTNLYSFGRDVLNVRMKALQSEGMILRTVSQTTFPLVQGQAKYALPSSTLDVDTAKPFVSNGLGTDVPLDNYSRGMYMALTNKAVTGQPTNIYVEKTATINVYLYPVPDGTWPTMTLPIVSLLPDMNVATDDTGLQSKYLSTFITGVGSWFALAAGLLPRHQMLDKQYEQEKKLATNDDTERGSVTFVADWGGYAYRGSRRVL